MINGAPSETSPTSEGWVGGPAAQPPLGPLFEACHHLSHLPSYSAERLDRQRARARAPALEMGGQREHAAVGVPGTHDLEPDGEPVR